jgi:sulfur-oxidizing protein SoxB
MGYAIDVSRPMGSRITDMTLLKTGEALQADKTYVVSGWASVNEATVGPAIWDVVEAYIKRKGTVSVDPNASVRVNGA